VSALANFLKYYKFKATANAPFNDYAGYYTNANFALGAPQNTLPDYNIKANALYTMGGFAAMWSVSYIPTVTDPGDLFGGQSTTDSFTSSGKAYTIPSYMTSDLRIGYNFATSRGGLLRFTNQLSVGIGVNNLFNKKPPFIPSAAEDNTDKSTYDIIGRFYSFDITKRF
jgi:outer membrane receptor protein involved in Fe transport